jgi:uroporphyrinogen-III synthase
MSSALRAAGLVVVHEPVLSRSVVPGTIDHLSQVKPTDWLVITSAFAITAIPDHIGRVPRIAVIGAHSRRAAAERGFRVELISSDDDAESLFAELRNRVVDGRIYYPRSSLAKEPASWPGVQLISPILYTTGTRDYDRVVIDGADVVAVASPSAVRAVGDVPLPFASLGPVTSAALVALGKTPWVEARERSFDSLAKAIADQIDP